MIVRILPWPGDADRGVWVSASHDYDSFIRPVDWRDFTVIDFGVELAHYNDRQIDMHAALLGLHVSLRARLFKRTSHFDD